MAKLLELSGEGAASDGLAPAIDEAERVGSYRLREPAPVDGRIAPGVCEVEQTPVFDLDQAGDYQGWDGFKSLVHPLGIAGPVEEPVFPVVHLDAGLALLGIYGEEAPFGEAPKPGGGTGLLFDTVARGFEPAEKAGKPGVAQPDVVGAAGRMEGRRVRARAKPVAEIPADSGKKPCLKLGGRHLPREASREGHGPEEQSPEKDPAGAENADHRSGAARGRLRSPGPAFEPFLAIAVRPSVSSTSSHEPILQIKGPIRGQIN